MQHSFPPPTTGLQSESSNVHLTSKFRTTDTNNDVDDDNKSDDDDKSDDVDDDNDDGDGDGSYDRVVKFLKSGLGDEFRNF